MLHMKCSEPRSLVMRIRVCDYCRAPQYNANEKIPSNDGSVYMALNKGILSCKEHRHLAKRDYKAYLGRNSRIDMKDAEEKPEIKRFLDVLREREEGFPVLRSNGNVDHGWKLEGWAFDIADHIYKSKDSEYILRVKTIDINRDIHKGVALNDYLRNDISCHFQEGFVDIVNDALNVLNSTEFYREEMLEWEELSCEPDNGLMPDIPQIVTEISNSGHVYRVLVPELENHDS